MVILVLTTVNFYDNGEEIKESDSLLLEKLISSKFI